MEKVFILIIAVLSAIFIAYPFFRNKSQEGLSEEAGGGKTLPEERLGELNSRKESLYAAIKEFDFDYSMGKLSKEDYDELKSKYKIQAIGVLKEIDDIRQTVDTSDLEEELEKEIRAKRDVKLINEDEIETEILKARRSRVENPSGFACSNCGNEYKPNDGFCSKCGARLSI